MAARTRMGRSEMGSTGGNWLADITLGDDLLDLPDRLRVQEGVTHHQGEPPRIGKLHQFRALRRGGSHRLLHQHVLAGEQSSPGQRMVRLDRRRYHDRIQLHRGEHLLEIRQGRRFRIEG